MFEHTTSRELVFQDLVEQTMTKHNYQCANRSRGEKLETFFPLTDPFFSGWWVYDIAGTTHTKVPRCCAVSETLGNRRLGDNLLTGEWKPT